LEERFQKTTLVYDSIDGNVAKGLPLPAISFLTRRFNAVVVLSYYPEQWKHGNVFLIPKKPYFAHTYQDF